VIADRKLLYLEGLVHGPGGYRGAALPVADEGENARLPVLGDALPDGS